MKNCHFRLFIIFCFINLQIVEAKAARGFNNQEVVLMNSFKTTHALFKKTTNMKIVPAQILVGMKQQLNKKDIPLPEFKLKKDGGIYFTFEGTAHRLSREGNNSFRLDGKLIDLKSKDWIDGSYNPNESMLNFLLIEKAMADGGGTLILLIVSGLVALTYCTWPSSTAPIRLTSTEPKELTASSWTWTQRKLANAFYSGLSSLKEIANSGCDAVGAAFADDAQMEEMAEKLMQESYKYCKAVASSFDSEQEFQASTIEKKQATRGPPIIKSEFRTILADKFKSYKSQLSFPEDSNEYELLVGALQDPAFMKECVSSVFDEGTTATGLQPAKTELKKDVSK